MNDSNPKINSVSEELLKLSLSIPSEDKNKLISSISKDRGDSIVLFYCSVTKTLKLIHSIKDVGKTSWFPHSLLVALDGFSKQRQNPVIIYVNSMLVETEFEVPGLTCLYSITLTEEYLSTNHASRAALKFKSLLFLVFPPFLWIATCVVIFIK